MIKFKALTLLFVGIATVGSAQVTVPTKSDLLGKTPTEVISMGYQKWYDAYVDHHGESTAAMCDANSFFGACLYARNNAYLSSRPEEFKARIEKTRVLLKEFAYGFIQIGSCYSGGGTMWNPVYAYVLVDVEETVWGLVGGKAKTVPAMTTSQVTALFTATENYIKKNEKEIGGYGMEMYSPETARRSLSETRTVFNSITSIAKGLSRSHSDRMLEFCAGYAKIGVSP